MKKERTLGHATSIILHMSGEHNIEFNAQELELRSLNVMVGANGVGKSLIMKLIWVLQMITADIVSGMSKDLVKDAQFILDHSIPDTKALAIIGLKFASGALVKVYIIEGKITKVEYDGMDGIKPVGAPIYMSSTMRIFSAMKYYFAARKRIGADDPEKIILGLVAEDFRLYDIMYIEGLIRRMPYKITPMVSGMLNMLSEGHRDIDLIDFRDDDFVMVNSKGKVTKLSIMGNGEQAILNMTLGNALNS